MKRRDVVAGLLLGATTGGTVLAGLRGSAAVTGPLAAAASRRIIIFDRRFAAARQFAAAVAPDAWIARAIAGDITPLWHELLDRHWHQADAMYGMTTPDSFQGLKQLVADRFWRERSCEPAGELLKWALTPRVGAS